MATIKDVAQRAGVSVCTVSRTLAGKEYIKDETRQRVMDAVSALQYQPNRIAASLKTGRSFALALILPSITNIYYPKLARYVEQAAAESGYMVYLCTTENSLEKEKNILQDIPFQNIAGVIITPTSNEHAHIMELSRHNIPYVYLNRNFEDDIRHCIRIDNETAAFHAVTHLIENGHTSIGCVFQSFDNTSYEERYRGMVHALDAHGLSLDPRHAVLGLKADTPDGSVPAIMKMLSQPGRPDAVFACNDMLAFSVYKAAYNLGIRIPDDLSVFGYDNCIMADIVAPPLSSFSPPARELAQTAVQFINHFIKTGELMEVPVLSGHLVLRGSVNNKGQTDRPEWSPTDHLTSP